MKAKKQYIDKDPTGRSWAEIARCLGIKPGRIWTWRCVYPEVIEYIYSFDENSFENAYRKYVEASKDIRYQIREIYEELEYDRKISAFSKYLYESGIYSNSNTFATTAVSTFYSVSENIMRTSSYDRFIKIIEAYEQFKVKGDTMSYKETI